MDCYFLSRPVDEEGKPVREYKRMHNIWKEQYGTEITEQHLSDQVKMIKKNEWIQNLELTNIETSKTKTYRSIHNNDNTGERFYQDEGNIHQNEDTQVDTENLGEREITMIQDI